MGEKPWCRAAADVLDGVPMAVFGVSLIFSGQWLFQALGTTKYCAVSLKPLLKTSSIMTTSNLGVNRAAEGYSGVTVSNCRKRKNTIWKIPAVLNTHYPAIWRNRSAKQNIIKLFKIYHLWAEGSKRKCISKGNIYRKSFELQERVAYIWSSLSIIAAGQGQYCPCWRETLSWVALMHHLKSIAGQ